MRQTQQVGKKHEVTQVDARSAASDRGYLRVGIVVPRYGRTAVRRNKVKRRLRELARTILLPEPLSCDVVIKARSAAYQATFLRLRADIEELLRDLRRVYAANLS